MTLLSRLSGLAARLRRPTPEGPHAERGTGPAICLWGAEDQDGRALTLIAALHLVAADMTHCHLVAFDVVSPDVELALEALTYDTGLAVERLGEYDRPRGRRDWRQFDLLVAVARQAFDSGALKGAIGAGLPTVLAPETEHPTTTPVESVPNIFALDTPALGRLIRALSTRLDESGSLSQQQVREIAGALTAS